ncbi:MAG: LLM class F420-dependent oxidoreductase [Steroidobacteraceae bacterium]
MKFSGPLPWIGRLATPVNLQAFARRSEALGYDFVSVGEHIVYPRRIETVYPFSADGKMNVNGREPNFEIFVALTWVAAATSRIRLHSGVLVLPYRNPFESAKLAASLDVVSGGRLTLGVGIGWLKEEFDVFNIPFTRRGKLTDEYIRLLRALFEGAESFTGVEYSFAGLDFEPKPLQKPLPIWVGGNSGPAIRRAALLGHGWYPGLPTELIAAKKREIDDLRAQAGISGPFHVASGIGWQQPDGPVTPFSKQKQQVLEQLNAMREAGVTHVHVYFNELSTTESAEKVLDEAGWFAQEIMPSFRDPQPRA